MYLPTMIWNMVKSQLVWIYFGVVKQKLRYANSKTGVDIAHDSTYTKHTMCFSNLRIYTSIYGSAKWENWQRYGTSTVNFMNLGKAHNESNTVKPCRADVSRMFQGASSGVSNNFQNSGLWELNLTYLIAGKSADSISAATEFWKQAHDTITP